MNLPAEGIMTFIFYPWSHYLRNLCYSVSITFRASGQCHNSHLKRNLTETTLQEMLTLPPTFNNEVTVII